MDVIILYNKKCFGGDKRIKNKYELLYSSFLFLHFRCSILQQMFWMYYRFSLPSTTSSSTLVFVRFYLLVLFIVSQEFLPLALDSIFKRVYMGAMRHSYTPTKQINLYKYSNPILKHNPK